jgi:NTP pyrophosphatase (non-canonical NTP hydrolase)
MAQKEITIKEIQEWERNFCKKKGIVFDEAEQMRIAMFKLMEEVGETAKAVLEKKWEEVLAEVADVIVFASKVANIAEDNYTKEKLEDVMKRKLNYCEERTYDANIRKFDKPKNSEFK